MTFPLARGQPAREFSALEERDRRQIDAQPTMGASCSSCESKDSKRLQLLELPETDSSYSPEESEGDICEVGPISQACVLVLSIASLIDTRAYLTFTANQTISIHAA